MTGRSTEPGEAPSSSGASGADPSIAPLATLLGLDPTIPPVGDGLHRPALTAVGAWLLLAWLRFGFQGVLAPRAPVQFVLVGFYAWLGLAAGLWLAMVVAAGRTASAEPDARPSARTMVAVTGRAHRPVVIAGVIVLLFSLAPPIPLVGLVVAVVTAAWMGTVLAGGVRTLTRRSWARSIAVAALPYLLWLAVTIPYLEQRLGHLA